MNDGLMRTAFGLHRAGKLADAARLYRQVLAHDPRHADALFLLGSVHFQSGEFAPALARFDQALAVKPQMPEALAARGTALSNLERHQEALAAYDKALSLRPEDPQVLSNRGNALLMLGRAAQAIESYDRALAVRADYADAWRNRGTALVQLGRDRDALESFDRAVAVRPSFTDAWEDRASTLMRLGRREDAVASYDQALAMKPDSPDLLYNRGNILSQLKRYDEAIRDCEKLLALAPDYPYARGVLVHSKLQCCNWRSLDAEKATVASALSAGKRVVSPFNLKALSDSPEEHLRCAELWVRHECPPAPTPLWRGAVYSHDRIRLAYVSADFNNTAVGTLMAGVFEHHDRRRFETTAISFGPADRTPMRTRLEAAFERFIDLRTSSEPEIAARLREMEVDIAVDLMGFTGECRSAIFAHRPAPVQVNYLGFPGSMGAPYIDYIVADSMVIPPQQQRFYSEKVAYLPHSYLPADPKRAVAAKPSRSQAGLPDEGFVFASFNNSYKFIPAMFDIWMRLLGAVDESVLWLPQNNPSAMRNLVREAGARGVSAQRIVFAPPVPAHDEHLARLSLAGLFLDTLPYNAHSTAIDALSAGVPILTLLGGSFAGRAAAGALRAAGLADLIAETPAAYESMALRLARDSAALDEFKARLARSRDVSPLFDTQRLSRDLETVFETMWRRHQHGEPPASFAVASSS